MNWKEGQYLDVSIEGLPSKQLNDVLVCLQKQVKEKAPEDIGLYNFNRTPHGINSLKSYLSQAVATSTARQTGRLHIYYNLYGLKDLCFDWLIRQSTSSLQQTSQQTQQPLPPPPWTENQVDLFKLAHQEFYQPPDYIIYLHSEFGEENQSLYAQYEWLLDSNKCPIPVYKVSLDSKPENVVKCLLKIFGQLRKRKEIQEDLCSS